MYTIMELSMSKSRASISFPQADYDALVQLAQEHDISVAWLVRYAVSRTLRSLKDGTEQLPLPLGSPSTKR
jgi:hypothetical protein